MKINKKTKIYWSPYNKDKDFDWGILQYDPENLFEKLKNNMDKDSFKKSKSNLVMCPAVKNSVNKIYVFKNTVQSYFEFKENNEIIAVSKNHINASIQHDNSLQNCRLFVYHLPLIFFSENDINMTLSSPYFSNCPHLKYGSIVPGKFNISKWFRNINIEFNLWENVNEFKIEKDEDLFYVNFECNEEIELIRFDLNDRLLKIAEVTGRSSSWEKFIPLRERYERFKKSQMHKIVIKEIEKNII
jgi:hypothetical protein